MKNRTTLSLTALLMLMTIHLGFAQTADQVVIGEVGDFYTLNGSRNQDISKLPKMDRDIYILQNIVDDLFSGNRSSFRSRRSKGIYIPNNGVIFNISGNGAFGISGYQSWDDLVTIVDGETSTVLSKNYTDEELEKLNDEKEKKLEDLSKTFLSNYGSLLGELKESEKIQVSVNYSLHVKSSTRRNGQLAFVSSSKDINKRRLVSMVSVKDVKAYESGKLTQDQMMSRIESKSTSIDDADMMDAKILAGIFDDLFKTTYDGYLTRSGRTSWTYFEGFGVMYDLNLSSRSNGYSLRTTTEGEVVYGNNQSVKSDDFYKDIQSKYDEFESIIKSNIVKYGRTLRNLKSNEVVIVNLGLSANKKANLPKTIQFMIPKSAIDAFAKGQKSLEQVKGEITIKKLTASLNGQGHYDGLIYDTHDLFPTQVETAAEPTRARSVGRTTRTRAN
ncbi:MAG: hypothetical protein HEP71_24145 [Roseivirga sp.]|nr:hypothetical protein [Roseivirga sp.]